MCLFILTNATVKLMKIEFNFHCMLRELKKTTNFHEWYGHVMMTLKVSTSWLMVTTFGCGVSFNLFQFNFTISLSSMLLWRRLYYIEKVSLSSVDAYTGDVNLCNSIMWDNLHQMIIYMALNDSFLDVVTKRYQESQDHEHL